MPLDIYDTMPDTMRRYLAHYGWNFSKAAYEAAVRSMKRRNATTGRLERIEPVSKGKVEELLTRYNVHLEHDAAYNSVYLYNMAMADFFKSSIPDEQHIALYVKDVIDDPDNPGGNLFRHWYADCVAKGVVMDWEDIF